ncbi:MAG: alanine dehydrogenase [Anaerolineales bacterium]|nr:alanine dehydrogenase [Anaerolineales bacterium]
MNIAIPKERRPFEFRVGLPPEGVDMLVSHGHAVYVETGAGNGAGFADVDYEKAGARIVYSPEETFGRADLVLKFARPLKEELEMMVPGLTVAGFLHLAATRQDKIEMLLDKKITAIAYEQVEAPAGYRPILAPLSEIGGRMAVSIASRLLQNDQGGRGVLLGGIVGVPRAQVVIIGAGVVGGTAAWSFAAVGAAVTVIDIDLRRLQELHMRCPSSIETVFSTPYNIAKACARADILVGAILVPGERPPIVVTRKMVASMQPRSIIIDLSIDQGGCVETSRPTTSAAPTYVEEGVIHFCVPNIAGVLGRTGTLGLYNGTFPFLQAVAREGIEEAIRTVPGIELGIVTRDGKVQHLSRFGGVGGRGR